MTCRSVTGTSWCHGGKRKLCGLPGAWTNDRNKYPPGKVQPGEREMVSSSVRQRALITGVLGQDGWYLARRLAEAGHEVHGTDRHAERVAAGTPDLPGVEIHLADLADEETMGRLVEVTSDPP